MNQLVSFFAPTALPNAAGAAVRAQNGAQGGDFASILAQLQNALTAENALPIDPTQQAAQILSQLPPSLIQSAKSLSTEELAAQLQALTGAPAGENTPQIDALLALLNPANTNGKAQPGKPAAPDTNADTSVAAMLAALQLQTQSTTAQPTQTATDATATATHGATPPVATPPVAPTDLGLRGTIPATEQPPVQQPAQPETTANAKAAENAAAALLAPNGMARPKNETQPQQTQPAKTVSDAAKRKAQGAPADAAAATQTQNTPSAGKPSDAPTLGASTQPQADGSQLPANAPTQAKPDGAAPTTMTSLAATPAPVLPTLIDAQQMSVTVSAAPQAPVPLEALAVQIARRFEAGLSQFEISLHPADLGKVDISLSVGDDGHVHAMMRAERPETLDLLQRDARSLETQLRQAGLEVGSNALSFSLSGGNGQQRHAPFAGWPAFADAQDAAGAAKQDAAKAYIAVRNPDGLDIRV
jgi:flagellar hook-length control protein FliK